MIERHSRPSIPDKRLGYHQGGRLSAFLFKGKQPASIVFGFRAHLILAAKRVVAPGSSSHLAHGSYLPQDRMSRLGTLPRSAATPTPNCLGWRAAALGWQRRFSKSGSRRRPAITGASFKLSHPAGGLRSAPVGPASVKPPARTFLARKGGLQHRCNYRRAQRTKAPLRRTETKALSERSIATTTGGKSTARSVMNLTTLLSEGVAEVHVRRDRTTFMFTETVPTIN
jgi:hypothetical protein